MRLEVGRGHRRARGLLAAATVAAALGSCGGEAAEPQGPTVTQRITRDFGRELLSDDRAPLEGHRTVMRLLEAHNEVATGFDGDVVEAIDGRRQRREPPDESAWVFMVNGVEADEYPPDYRLHPGDVVHWDLRDWYVTLDVRATVGAFPETFTRGVFGKRFPVRLRCLPPSTVACREARQRLRAAGVDIDGSRPAGGLPPRGQPQRGRVLVGTWNRLRRGEWARRIDEGPRYSGIFARFSSDARSLRLLDWDDRTVRTEGPGTGLVGAMRPTEEDMLWLVTGVDEEGVERAARALDSDTLRDAFAVVLTRDGTEKIPLPPR